MKVNFFNIRQTHRMLIINLKAYLLGIDDYDKNKLLDINSCDLNNWIYDYALKNYKNKEIKDIEVIHKKYHFLVNKIVQLKKNGQVFAANNKYNELSHLNNELMELLKKIEKIII